MFAGLVEWQASNYSLVLGGWERSSSVGANIGVIRSCVLIAEFFFYNSIAV
jgi:hypothetical protein